MKDFELFVVIVAVYYVFHQAPQVEKESGAKGEDIGHYQEPLWTMLHIEYDIVSFTLSMV